MNKKSRFLLIVLIHFFCLSLKLKSQPDSFRTSINKPPQEVGSFFSHKMEWINKYSPYIGGAIIGISLGYYRWRRSNQFKPSVTNLKDHNNKPLPTEQSKELLEYASSLKPIFFPVTNLKEKQVQLALSSHNCTDIIVYSPHSAFVEKFKVTERLSDTSLNLSQHIAEALQSEAAFTNAKDPKPIVATYGCGPCVAMGGYDKINNAAFVVHFATANEVEKCGDIILYNIIKSIKNPIVGNPIQIHLRGGRNGSSEKTIEAIERLMKRDPALPMELASRDVLGCSTANRSLSLDSRDGTVGIYDPRTNPGARKMDDFKVMACILSAYEPNIQVVYPKN